MPMMTATDGVTKAKAMGNGEWQSREGHSDNNILNGKGNNYDMGENTMIMTMTMMTMTTRAKIARAIGMGEWQSRKKR